MKKLTGPFTQILPLTGMPQKGALKDEQLHIIPNGGVLVEDGLILAVDNFEKLRKKSRRHK
jgi:imidazolonepropionase